MSDTQERIPIEVLLEHGAWARRLARTLVFGDAADDVVQQTWLLALKRPPSTSIPVRAWLAAVMRRIARHVRREHARRVRREHAVASPGMTPPADAAVERARLHHELVALVLALDEPCRSTVLLRYFEQLPPRVIAKRQQVGVATVKTRLKRGLGLLRERLHRAHHGPGSWQLALAPLASLPGNPVSGPSSSPAALVGTGSATLGVMLMTTTVKLATTGLIVAGLGIAAWHFASEGGPSHAESRATSTATDAVTVPPAAARDLVAPAPANGDAPHVALGDGSSAAASTSVRPAVLVGTVVTQAGDPARSAHVFVIDTRGSAFGSRESFGLEVLDWTDHWTKSQGRGWRSVTTDDAGRFTFDELDLGALVDVAAIHEDFGLAFETGVTLSEDQRPAAVRLTLESGIVLLGRVTDESNTPIAGATIDISGYHRDREGRLAGTAVASARTDEHGNYRSFPVPYRSVSVSASAPEFLAADDVELFNLAETDHQRRVDFRLRRSLLLRGRILGPDGRPANLVTDIAARVGGRALLTEGPRHITLATLRDDPRLHPLTAAPRENGRVLFDADRYEVELDPSTMRFVSLWCGNTMLGCAETEPGSKGPDLVIDPSLVPAPPPTGAFTVRVLDANSLAVVSQYRVRWRKDHRDPSQRLPRATERRIESSDGCSRCESIEAGSYVIEVRTDQHAPAWSSVLVEPQRTTEVEVHLVRGTAAIRGSVIGPGNSLIDDATVLLYRPDGELALPFPECFAHPDREGRFAFTGVPAGTLVLVARGAELAACTAEVTLVPGTERAVTLQLERGVAVSLVPSWDQAASPSPYVALRILDARGITLADQLGPAQRIRALAATFTCYLAPGQYTAEAYSSLHAPARVAFRAGEGARIVLPLVGK